MSDCEVHVPGRDAPSPWCAACRTTHPPVTADHAQEGQETCVQADHDVVWQAGWDAGYRDAMLDLAESRGQFFDELDSHIADSLRRDREYVEAHDAAVLAALRAERDAAIDRLCNGLHKWREDAERLRAERDALRERVEALVDDWTHATCETDGAPCSWHRVSAECADELRALLADPSEA